LISYLNKAKNAVSDLNKQKREIENSELSDKDKRAQIQTIQVLINEIYKTALTDKPAFEEVIIQTEYETDPSIGYSQATQAMYGSERALREYNEDVYNNAVKSGIDFDTYYDAYFTLKTFTTDKDKEGNPINGSKKGKVVSYVNSLSISRAEKVRLLESFGYKVAA
jgi:hypothetical protein